MSDDKFKLPGSSYEELCKIIRSYGFFDKPFTLDEAAQVTKMHRTQVSRNNGFLGAVGIIEGDRTKTTSDLGKRLARALEFERGDEIASAWRDIVGSNEFLSKMLAAVKIRKGMDESTLKSHIAYSAGQQKTKDVMAGAQSIIDILKSAELLSEKDGQLIPTSLVYSNSDQITQEDVETTIVNNQKLLPNTQTIKEIVRSVDLPSGVPVNIQIQISVTPSDLDDLGQKIRKLLDDLSTSSKEDSSAENEIN
ncbi:MAG: hypothetical protein KJZ77_15790 [Anaerolineales bacterium]|nr:hypothetical protein [Anaerolineales bacterium]